MLATDKLRVGINFGNTVLARRDDNSVPFGIAVDLAHELARRLNAGIEVVSYDSAGRMADGAKAGAWDVAFLGADPDRAGEIAFTAPYLEMDATYLVPPESMLHHVDDVDDETVRIAVSQKSAYDLFLTRELKRARLVRIPGPEASIQLFFSEKLEALAGIRPMLVEVAESHPGTSVLDGRYTVVRQAVGTPRDRAAELAGYLREFVEDIKASGLAQKVIDKNGIRGVSVAPPGSL